MTQTIIIIFLIFFLILSLIYFLHYKALKNEKKKLEQAWGRKIERSRNFSSICKYSIFDKEINCYNLTEQTLSDIDIESLFSFIDRTETAIGQQYLYSKIENPSLSVNVLKSRGENSDYFISNVAVRNKARFMLYKLEKKETSLISDFFENTLVVMKSKYEPLLKLLSASALLSVVIFFIYKPVAIFMIILFGINLMIHLIFRHNNSNKLKAIRQSYQLIKTVNKLAALDIPINFENIPSASRKLQKFTKTYHFLDFGIPLNDISSIIFYVLDLVKSFFLIEVHLLNFSYNEIIKQKGALMDFFIYVGQVEIALSTASLKCDNSIVSCIPIFSEEIDVLDGTNLIHPVVVNCIPNSISLCQSNAFITGSNMSGKSTFLRTLIINSVMAQSLNLCFAESFRTSILKAFSSIKIADNLQAGTSYYFEEVNVIHEMVLNSNSGSTNLFIIDEIFKGTNTVERIALSKSILQYLCSPGNVVIASSHDLELVELLGNKFDLYHFTESIINDQLHFDHKIKFGPLKTRNAIKIVEMEGFPDEIVTEANALTNGIENITLLNKLIP